MCSPPPLSPDPRMSALYPQLEHSSFGMESTSSPELSSRAFPFLILWQEGHSFAFPHFQLRNDVRLNVRLKALLRQVNGHCSHCFVKLKAKPHILKEEDKDGLGWECVEEVLSRLASWWMGGDPRP